MKKTILAVIAIFVVWSLLDFLIHRLMRLVTATCATTFTAIYSLLITRKYLATGLRYGLFYGIAQGLPWELAHTASCRYRDSWRLSGSWARSSRQ